MKSNVTFKTFISLVVATLTSTAIFAGILLVASLVLLDDNPTWEESAMFNNELEQQLSIALNQAAEYDDLMAIYDEPLDLKTLEEESRRLDSEIALLQRRSEEISLLLMGNYYRAEEDWTEVGWTEKDPAEEDRAEEDRAENNWSREPAMTKATAGTWAADSQSDYESSLQAAEKAQEPLLREQQKIEQKLQELLNRQGTFSNLSWDRDISAWEFVLQRENDVLTNRRDLLPPESPLTIHKIPMDVATAAAKEQYYNYSLSDGQLYWDDGSVSVQAVVAPVEVKGFAFTPKVHSNIDGFQGAWLVWYALHGKFTYLLLTTIVSAVAAILLMVWLFSSSGYVSEKAADGSQTMRLKLSWFDYIPFDLLLLFVLFFPVIALGGSSTFWYLFTHRFFPFGTVNLSSLSRLYDETAATQLLLRYWTLGGLLLFVAVLLFGILLLSVIRRVKLHRFLRSTIAGALLLLLIRGIRAGWKALVALATRTRLFLLAAFWVLSVPLVILTAVGRPAFYPAAILYVVAGFLVLLHLYRRQLDARDSLKATTSALAAGDIEVRMQAPGMPVWDDITSNLDSIGAGVRQAVEERMQSERLKTELITNVSHDLKTPLTSIINYIDLLHRPGLSDAERADCLAVLTQKSQQLKRLTEDLVEASKASSGALQVQLESFDVVELLQQAAGENLERMKRRQLALILHLPPGLQSLQVESDSRHLWRILENILGNAAKYALSGSRVHVTLLLNTERWTIRVRNVSEQPIDLSTDELMERFVRGDRSRSSEGSGLGLAIARGLTERLGGVLTLAVEQDLFTVELSFPAEGSETVMRAAAGTGAGTTTASDGGAGADADAGADDKMVSESTAAEALGTVAGPGAVSDGKFMPDSAGAPS
ncbi:MAG: HAMP domain-containing sensor histidine kinase [Bacillota bacterium]|nr:HAMP domain-containing sensor histidine kinase [Bacillota bacterium]